MANISGGGMGGGELPMANIRDSGGGMGGGELPMANISGGGMGGGELPMANISDGVCGCVLVGAVRDDAGIEGSALRVAADSSESVGGGVTPIVVMFGSHSLAR